MYDLMIKCFIFVLLISKTTVCVGVISFWIGLAVFYYYEDKKWRKFAHKHLGMD